MTLQELKSYSWSNGKVAADAARVIAIVEKGLDNLTTVDRMQLLQIYKVAYHDSGKIEGTFSCDSSCNGCTFCQRMRAAAEKDPTIICGKCYDAKQENYRFNTRDRHTLNLFIMSTVLFTVAELATLPGGYIMRINSSGDIENAIHAENMINIAYAKPLCNVALWTKNTPAVDSVIDRIGKPANLVYIVSSIHINRPGKLSKYADYTFTVYDADQIENALAAGAVECNGKKCQDCGYKCYTRAWPAKADIAEKLRK